jgi:RNA polymerase sigma-70 factor (ECF subfamily)
MRSLLYSVRDGTNKEAWRRLIGLCSPLLYDWLRCQNLQHADAEDLVQETLITVALEAPTLQFNGNPRAFRLWLHKVLVNRLLNFRRAQRVHSICRSDSELLGQLADTIHDPRSDPTFRGDDGHDGHLARQVMKRIKPEFQGKTWQAFCRVALEGDDPQVVAAELHLSRSSVYVAKCRVLKRLRQEVKKPGVTCKKSPADALIEVGALKKAGPSTIAAANSTMLSELPGQDR